MCARCETSGRGRTPKARGAPASRGGPGARARGAGAGGGAGGGRRTGGWTVRGATPPCAHVVQLAGVGAPQKLGGHQHPAPPPPRSYAPGWYSLGAVEVSIEDPAVDTRSSYSNCIRPISVHGRVETTFGFT